jgi:glycosyltransferase involved in cell wall biosynthesis
VPARALRVLHVPAVVGGHAIGLARAERELGLDSIVVSFDAPPFGYSPDEVLFSRSRSLTREIRRWTFLRRALREADVVHFNFGSTILPRYWPSVHGTGMRRLYGLYARLVEGLDLAALRRAGKGIVVTYQGDDARTAQSLRARVDAAWIDDYYDPRDDSRKRRMVARFASKAHAIFALNPDLLDELPARAEFVPYAHVDPRRVKRTPIPDNRPPVVVHLPTDRRVKGTDALVAAADDLGGEVDLRLVEGVPHVDALRAIADADIVVDQLLTGWYGGVTVEAMAMGRPVVAHVREPDLDRIPPEQRTALPIVDATPQTIAAVLRSLLETDRERLATASRAYVERWHDPLKIAERMRDAYEGAVAMTSTSR